MNCIIPAGMHVHHVTMIQDKSRQYLILPGVRSSRLHIVDTATDPRAPSLHKVVEGDDIKEKTDLSGPHTVHCLGSDIIISMLGNS